MPTREIDTADQVYKAVNFLQNEVNHATHPEICNAGDRKPLGVKSWELRNGVKSNAAHERFERCMAQLAKAYGGFIANSHDELFPHRMQVEGSMVTCLMEIFQLAQELGLDLPCAYVERVRLETRGK